MALLLVPTLALSVAPPAAAATVPTYFADTLVAGGLSSPRSLDFFPDGRIVVIENDGQFLLVNGTTSTSMGNLTGLATSGEQGLLGVAIDPDFPARPYIYTHSTTPSAVQVSRFTIVNYTGPGPTEVDLGSRVIYLSDMPNVNTNHNGGTLRFGPDKMLYISIGDDAQGSGCTAQNLSFMGGKILRIKVDDTVNPSDRSTLAPSDNPFFGDPRVNATLVWSYGLRNPFRFDIDPATGTLYIGDVGQSAWEEIDRVPVGGANLGWPYYEANATYRGTPCPTDASIPGNLTFPIYAFPNSGSAIVLGAVYRGVDYPNDASFPPEFDQNLFYVDFYEDPLHIIRSPDNLTNWSLVAGNDDTDWANGLQFTADLQEGPDGAIYWVSEAGQLRRISHNPVPSVATASLPFGTVGVDYSAQLAASGGPAPFTWSLASGSLPGGLSLDNGTGVISGTPTGAVNASFSVQVTSAANRSGTRALTLEVAEPVTIAPATMADAVEGQDYAGPLAAMGGVAPFTWSLDLGTLPAGLDLSPTVGHITGIPTQYGAFSFSVRATDSQGRFGVQAISLTVIQALAFSTSTLPNAVQGVYYEAAVGAVGGVPPYAFAVNASSAMPAGLSFGTSNGTLYGTPTSAQAAALVLEVSDSGGQFASASFGLAIAPPPGGPPLIAVASIPAATEGAAYEFFFTALEGTPPLDWTVEAAALPPGINYAAGQVRIHGTPNTVGSWSFNVSVTDSQARSDTRLFTLTVLARPRSVHLGAVAFADGELGIGYGAGPFAFTGENLSAQVRWEAAGLPGGLSIDAQTGGITGLPTEAGTFNVTLRVFDSLNAGVEDNATAVLRVTRISISTGASLGTLSSGVGAIITLSASGASAGVTWTVVNGSLPPGLTLDANGTLHGTPTIAGNYSFTVRAARNGAATTNFEEQTMTVAVSGSASPPPPPPPPPPTSFPWLVLLAGVLGLAVLVALVRRRKAPPAP